jgi:hypothetical protein
MCMRMLFRAIRQLPDDLICIHTVLPAAACEVRALKMIAGYSSIIRRKME